MKQLFSLLFTVILATGCISNSKKDNQETVPESKGVVSTPPARGKGRLSVPPQIPKTKNPPKTYKAKKTYIYKK